MLSRELLHRLATGWDKRARVRSSATFADIDYDATKEDFIESLLPFATHPLYKKINPKLRANVLSCGWIIYNAKTITIETDIVNPLCVSILNENFHGTQDVLIKQLVTETMVDEAYHVHLCSYANEITKSNRHLYVKVPEFSFIRQLKHAKATYAENWQQNIIHLVAAITSEIYITDYLDLVHSKESNIQPLNRLIVKTHRSDELAHGKIFDYLAQVIFHYLNKKEKYFFHKMMAQPLTWLEDNELDVWLSLLEQIKFPHALQMIEDCKHNLHFHKPTLNEGIKNLLRLTAQLV